MAYKATRGGKFVVILLFIIGVGLFGTIITLFYMKGGSPGLVEATFKPSIFTIRQGTIEATGFFITDSGYGVSAAYPFMQARDDKVKTKMLISGAEFDARIIAVDLPRDIALLEFPPGAYKGIRLGSDAGVSVNDRIITFQLLQQVEGTIAERAGGSMTIQLAGTLNDTALGAPLIHRNSRALIGMVGQRVSGQGESHRRIISTSDIAAFFQSERGVNLLNQGQR
jgi:hypothetical protein